MSNPNRTLASSIVTACKKDGLKQSVILNVITKQQGFRSIQASDIVNTLKTPTNPAETFAVRVALLEYFPNSDLFLPVESLQQSVLLNTTFKIEDVATYLWSSAMLGIEHTQKEIVLLSGNLCRLKQTIEIHTNQINNFEDIYPLIPTGLPESIIKFLKIEFAEVSQGCDDLLNTIKKVVSNLIDDINDVLEVFTRDAYTLYWTVRHFVEPGSKTHHPIRLQLISAITELLNDEEKEQLGDYDILIDNSVPVTHLMNAVLDFVALHFPFSFPEAVSVLAFDGLMLLLPDSNNVETGMYADKVKIA